MPDVPVPPPPPPAVPGPDVSAPTDVAGAATDTKSSESPTDFNIGEEYGTARKNLPPARIVAICVAGAVIIAGIYAAMHRAHALSRGTVEDGAAVSLAGPQMVMVAAHITIQNNEHNATV